MIAARFTIAMLVAFLLLGRTASAAIKIDPSDPGFSRLVEAELAHMRSGKRGIVSRQLVDRLDASTATTTISPLGLDESTWHPNDRRGTRSYVSAVDTRLRGAERSVSTDAILYLHPARIDPNLSLFRLGTFVHYLSLAADLNEGRFSGNFQKREKRAAFYRNAWLDSLGLKPVLLSDRVPTPEYPRAKELGLLTEENSLTFPILDPKAPESPAPAAPGASPSP